MRCYIDFKHVMKDSIPACLGWSPGVKAKDVSATIVLKFPLKLDTAGTA